MTLVSGRSLLHNFLSFVICILLTSEFEGRKGFGNVDQDWGYITVRPKAHMFWWLFYTTASVSNYTEKPLIIWLQGGPGMPSSGYGVFSEIGPWDADLNERNHTWLKDFNVLFIDNPVGVGFSFFDNSSDFVKDNKEIGKDLVKFFEKFINEHPEFETVPMYIFGESYGGKMAVEFAYQIYLKKRKQKINCNLKGVGLGDSYISPLDYLIFYGPLAYNLGLIDKANYNELNAKVETAEKLLSSEKYEEASYQETMVTGTLVKLLGGVDLYNFAEKMTPLSPLSLWRDEDKLNVIMNQKVRPALNISDSIEWQFLQSLTYNHLKNDFLKSVTDRIESLLNKTDIKIIVYNGIMDILVNTAGTARWINNLKWKYSAEWQNTTQAPFVENDVIEGYVKEYENLVFYTVFRAGHSVPIDNPDAMDYILTSIKT